MKDQKELDDVVNKLFSGLDFDQCNIESTAKHFLIGTSNRPNSAKYKGDGQVILKIRTFASLSNTNPILIRYLNFYNFKKIRKNYIPFIIQFPKFRIVGFMFFDKTPKKGNSVFIDDDQSNLLTEDDRHKIYLELDEIIKLIMSLMSLLILPT